MPADLQQLVLETVEQIGVDAPPMLDSDAPIFSSTAQSLYLIGLIGGKDVGKSSLVNALVGSKITTETSFGEGTARVIAYAHDDSVDELQALLERDLSSEQFQIVPHPIDSLRSQVLLDLPDIDSRWTGHVQLTRRMLRHMLFPIWVQSIEKYADQQPQELLRQVSQGNDPSNFLFCLNKADQLSDREGSAAVEAVRNDFAARIGRTLNLAEPARVFLISAKFPDRFDLPALRDALSIARSRGTVERSIELAGAQRERSLLDWLARQNLPERAARAERLRRDAQETVAERIAGPILEDTLPRLAGDPAYRLGLIEAAMNRRLSRWPIVNVINTSLSPLMLLVRKNLSTPAQTSNDGATGLVARGRSVTALVQTAFAQLRQIDPTIATLYDDRRLWEDAPADFAASDLSARIASTIDRQRDETVRRLGGGGAIELLAAPIRWLFTIGAALWFPLVQPVLKRFLDGPLKPNVHDIAVVIVPLLGASYLLHSAAFLIIYFAALWMLLRWDTHRRVNRLLARWSRANAQPQLSFAGQIMLWTDDLLEPLAESERAAAELSRKIEAYRESE